MSEILDRYDIELDRTADGALNEVSGSDSWYTTSDDIWLVGIVARDKATGQKHAFIAPVARSFVSGISIDNLRDLLIPGVASLLP